MISHALASVFSASAGRGRETAGVVVAVLSACLYDVGYVLEKQALDRLPALKSHPLQLLSTVRRSRRWTAGFVTMLAGLALQVVALTLAPVSVVQPILACGLVGLVAVGGRVLGERLGRRQVAALTLVLTAVLAIALSSHAAASVATHAPLGRFAGLALPVAAAGLALASVGARVRPGSVVASSVGAGLLYGVGAVAEKAVATELVAHGMLGGAIASLATPYPWIFVLATVCGLVVFQVGLQRHPASLMATFTNVASSVCALVGAAVVFGEALLPSSGWAVARLLGFASVLAAVVVLMGDRSVPQPAAATTA